MSCSYFNCIGRVFGIILTAMLSLMGSVAVGDDAPDKGTRPNILIITADNLGYGDLPSFNPDSKIKVPNFDRLASSGAKLTQFYTASPTCTVSRACLLTGRIPQRHGLVDQLAGLEGNYGVGLNPKEVLLPQVLRAAGYATGCFGKWNIGFAPGSRPTERGFDEFFGNASGKAPPVEMGVLAAKGSLFVTRPTLFTFLSIPEKADAMIADLFAMVESGKVRIEPAHRYPLSEVQQAHKDLEARKTTGTVILLP